MLLPGPATAALSGQAAAKTLALTLLRPSNLHLSAAAADTLCLGSVLSHAGFRVQQSWAGWCSSPMHTVVSVLIRSKQLAMNNCSRCCTCTPGAAAAAGAAGVCIVLCCCSVAVVALPAKVHADLDLQGTAAAAAAAAAAEEEEAGTQL